MRGNIGASGDVICTKKLKSQLSPHTEYSRTTEVGVRIVFPNR